MLIEQVNQRIYEEWGKRVSFRIMSDPISCNFENCSTVDSVRIVNDQRRVTNLHDAVDKLHEGWTDRVHKQTFIHFSGYKNIDTIPLV